MIENADYIALGLGIWQVVQIIVRLTPTKKDDEIVSKLGKFINIIFNKSNIKK